MPECQQGTQRRSGVPQTSAGCQKLENTRGMKRDPLRQARRGPTHARTGWRAVDSCSPLWPLIFEAQYNLRATVFTFLCHLTKYKAAKRGEEERWLQVCVWPPSTPCPVSIQPTPSRCVTTIPFRQWDSLDLYPKMKVYPVWSWKRNDLKSLLPIVITTASWKLTSGWCALDGSAFERISPEMEFLKHGK